MQTKGAHRTIEDSVEELAGEILRAVLPKGPASLERAR
jgi:hypothetical protein